MKLSKELADCLSALLNGDEQAVKTCVLDLAHELGLAIGFEVTEAGNAALGAYLLHPSEH